jgi:hypothetical protein
VVAVMVLVVMMVVVVVGGGSGGIGGRCGGGGGDDELPIVPVQQNRSHCVLNLTTPASATTTHSRTMHSIPPPYLNFSISRHTKNQRIRDESLCVQGVGAVLDGN